MLMIVGLSEMLTLHVCHPEPFRFVQAPPAQLYDDPAMFYIKFSKMNEIKEKQANVHTNGRCVRTDMSTSFSKAT